MNRLILVTFIIFSFCSYTYGEKSSLPVILEGGYRGGYSSGLLKAYLYHRLYLKGGYQGDSLTLAAVGSYYMNYQISNTTGESRGIDTTRLGIESVFRFSDYLSFSIEGSGWFGESHYRRGEGLAGFVLEKGKWYFTGETGGGTASYYMNASHEKSWFFDLYFEAAREITGKMMIDGSYSFLLTGMQGLESMHKHMLRAGFSYLPGKGYFLFGGATIGMNSRGYTNIGIDCGGRIYLARYVRLSLSYLLSYGNSFNDTEEVMPGPGNTSEESYYLSHRLLFSVVLKYR